MPLAHWRVASDQTELPKHALAAWGTCLLLVLGLLGDRLAKAAPRPWPWALRLMGLLLLWQLLVWPFARDPQRGLKPILMLAESLLWVVVCFGFMAAPGVRRYALVVLMAAGGVAAFFGLCQYEELYSDAFPGGLVACRDWLAQSHPWLQQALGSLEQTDAPGSFFGHANLAAEFIGATSVLALVVGLARLIDWSRSRQRWSAWVFWACSLVAAPGLLFVIRSGSRSAVLAIAIALACAFFHGVVAGCRRDPLFGSRGRHLAFNLLLLVVVSGALAIAGGLGTSPRSGQVQKTLLQRLESSLDFEETTVKERLDLWSNSLAMVEDHPIFGVGPGGFKSNYPLYSRAKREHDQGRLSLRRQPAKPHNEYIHFIVEGGWLAGLIFLAFWPRCSYRFCVNTAPSKLWLTMRTTGR